MYPSGTEMPPAHPVPCHRPRRLAVLAAACLLTGCVAVPPNGTPTTPGQAAGRPTAGQAQPTSASRPPRDLYEAAKSALNDGDLPRAARLYRRLLADEPEHPRAREAGIELAYVYYRMGDGESAEATAGRFIRRHPDDSRLDYLFYLRGLAHYGIAHQERQHDPYRLSPHAQLAIEAFEQLKGRFPQSRYADDAGKRIAELRQGLIEQQLALAKRLLEQGRYAAAGLDAQAVIDNEASPEAIKDEARTLLKMSYKRLGLLVEHGPKPKPRPPAARIHHERWIMAQRPSDYTLQIIGAGNEPALHGFVRRQEFKGDLAIFRTRREGKPWYTLIMGRFPDRARADAAAGRLLEHFPEIKPWVRPMADIQRIVSEQIPEAVEARPAEHGIDTAPGPAPAGGTAAHGGESGGPTGPADEAQRHPGPEDGPQ